MENKFLLGIGVNKGNQLWTTKKKKVKRKRESCKIERPKNHPTTWCANDKREASFNQIQNQKKIKKKACFGFLKTRERTNNKLVGMLVTLEYFTYIC